MKLKDLLKNLNELAAARPETLEFGVVGYDAYRDMFFEFTQSPVVGTFNDDGNFVKEGGVDEPNAILID